VIGLLSGALRIRRIGVLIAWANRKRSGVIAVNSLAGPRSRTQERGVDRPVLAHGMAVYPSPY
jgi:hypothetical protein